MERFWCPAVWQDVGRYVKTCDPCQHMRPLPQYASKLSRPITGLFDLFYIKCLGPFPRPYEGCPRHLLVFVEHLTVSPIVRATRDEKEKTEMEFMGMYIIHSFMQRKVLLNYNAGCFTAVGLERFMKENGNMWKPVAA